MLLYNRLLLGGLSQIHTMAINSKFTLTPIGPHSGLNTFQPTTFQTPTVLNMTHKVPHSSAQVQGLLPYIIG